MSQIVIPAQRFPSNPLITPSTFENAGLSDTEGNNINGPSVIRTPDWLPNRLGNYYLYFAHHNGHAIRLAYADSLQGPWRLYTSGPPVLRLGDGIVVAGGKAKIVDHIASPDVHIDPLNRAIVMYFHGPVITKSGEHLAEQKSFMARSGDGLDFVVQPYTPILGESYFRVFSWRGRRYAISNRGWLWRDPEGFDPFDAGHADSIADAWQRGPNPLLDHVRSSEPLLLPRHSAVRVEDDTLDLFITYIGHDPERVLYSRIELFPDWNDWHVNKLLDVVRPEMDYEGVNSPTGPSVGGAQTNVRQLRDPYYFVDADNQRYLFYTVRGELGIAGAALPKPQPGQ